MPNLTLENALARELAKSIVEDNRVKLNSIIESSYSYKIADSHILDKDFTNEETFDRKKLKEPLL